MVGTSKPQNRCFRCVLCLFVFVGPNHLCFHYRVYACVCMIRVCYHIGFVGMSLVFVVYYFVCLLDFRFSV
jgi:hypothetical protein